MNATLEQVRARLIAQASETHADHPQYAGYWDDWELGQITANVVLRRRRVARVGEYVLVRPRHLETIGGITFRTVYLPGNLGGANTAILARDVRLVDER